MRPTIDDDDIYLIGALVYVIKQSETLPDKQQDDNTCLEFFSVHRKKPADLYRVGRREDNGLLLVLFRAANDTTSRRSHKIQSLGLLPATEYHEIYRIYSAYNAVTVAKISCSLAGYIWSCERFCVGCQRNLVQ